MMTTSSRKSFFVTCRGPAYVSVGCLYFTNLSLTILGFLVTYKHTAGERQAVIFLSFTPNQPSL